MWYVRPAKAQMRHLIRTFASGFEYYITVKLLAEYHLEFLNLKRSCRGAFDSILVKRPHCWN